MNPLVSKPRFVGAFVWNNGGLSIPNNVDTALTFNAETTPGFDPVNMHSTVTNTSRLTIVEKGYYAGVFGIFVSLTTGGRRFAYWFKNGAVIGPTQQWQTGDGTNGYYGMCTLAPVYCVVGDYLEAFVWQNRGGTETFGVAGAFTAGSAFASVWKIG